jgi:hypothetical protein
MSSGISFAGPLSATKMYHRAMRWLERWRQTAPERSDRKDRQKDDQFYWGYHLDRIASLWKGIDHQKIKIDDECPDQVENS